MFESQGYNPFETTKLYKGKVELVFDKARHLYTVNGVPVDGTTSALGVISKPALLGWAVKVTAEYIDANLPVGVALDELQKKKLLDEAKKQHRTKKTDAGDSGTMLHAAVEKFAKGEPVAEFVNPILKNSFAQFKDWVAKNKVVFKCSERKVYSIKHNYAGTLDLIAHIAGKRVLLDVKTSSNVWDEMFLQLSAYKAAIQEEFPTRKIHHVGIIRCGKDGSFEVVEANDHEKNFEAFLGALALYRRLKVMNFERRQTVATPQKEGV